MIDNEDEDEKFYLHRRISDTREKDDGNAILRFYLRYREFLHIAGFIVLLAFTLGGSWTTWQAQAKDIENLKTRMTVQEYTSGRILQSLDDIKDFLHVPERRE